MNQKELIKAVNERMKNLASAEKSGIEFDKVTINQFKALLKTVGKKSFYFNKLTASQRQLMREAGEKFLKSKGSTVEGAHDTLMKKRENFRSRMRENSHFEKLYDANIPFEYIEDVFRQLKYEGAFEIHGSSPKDDFILDLVYKSYDNLLDKITGEVPEIEDVSKEAILLWKKIEGIEDSLYGELSKFYYSSNREVGI